MALLVAIAYSCATPTSPTGGPSDKEGPTITFAEPETGTTNFDKKSITLHFSEFVNRGSIQQAIVVEPDIGIDYALDWGRKSLAIKFDEKIPDLTTLIVTIGTDLTDMNGNKMAEPYKIAVSTGPEIDKGKLGGRILDAKTGKGKEGQHILLYRRPFDLKERANYIAETDTGGVFRFSYLRQGEYKAFWVEDRNRNKIWDPDRERAQPFASDSLSLEKAGADSLGTLFIANADTSKPVLQGMGLFSSKRMRMRFSENIKLLDSTRIVISDTLGNRYSDAFPLYVSPTDPYVLFSQSKKSLVADSSYSVRVYNIADESDNVRLQSSLQSTGSAQKDTTMQRPIRRTHEAGIYPDEPLEIIYATPISNAVIRDSLKVVEGTKLKPEWEHLNITQNKLRILPDQKWQDGVDYEFRVWNPSIEGSKSIRPTIWHPNDFGKLNIQLGDTTNSSSFNLRIITEERGSVTDTTFKKKLEIKGLPPLNYQVIVFEDLNKNGRWDKGTVFPYEAPEPYFIQNDVPVKKGFTSDLVVSFDKER